MGARGRDLSGVGSAPVESVRDGAEPLDLDVRGLLAAYDRVLGASERERPIAWVRVRPDVPCHRRWTVPSLPRPTWLLRFFVVWHITNATNELSRRLARRAALQDESEREADDRAAVDVFREGVPPVHLRTALALLIVATVVLGRLALQHAGAVLSAVPAFRNLEEYRDPGLETFTDAKPQPAVPVSEEAAKLFDRVGQSVGTDVSSLGKALDALAGARALDIALLAVGVMFAVYVVARPVMPAFRMKRLLFNLDDQVASWRPMTTARWHVPRRVGVYAREDRVFAALGGARRREMPIDLIVPALLWCSLPVALGAFVLSRATTVVYEIYPPWIGWDYAVEMGCVLLALAGARIAWLIRTWRSRRHWEPATAILPYQVEASDGRRLTVRDPLQVAAFALLVPYYTMIWVVSLQSLHASPRQGPGGVGSWQAPDPVARRVRSTRLGSSTSGHYLVCPWDTKVAARDESGVRQPSPISDPATSSDCSRRDLSASRRATPVRRQRAPIPTAAAGRVLVVLVPVSHLVGLRTRGCGIRCDNRLPAKQTQPGVAASGHRGARGPRARPSRQARACRRSPGIATEATNTD